MLTWQYIIELLLSAEPGAFVRIPSSQIAHPMAVGMTPAVGLPVGQRATFLASIDDQRVIDINDFVDYYDARLSAWLPVPPPIAPAWPPAQAPALVAAPIEQAIREAPGTTVLATTALGVLFGALSGTKDGTLTGALVGGAAGLAAVSAATATTAPETSQRTQELMEALLKLASSTNAPMRTAPALPASPTSGARARLRAPDAAEETAPKRRAPRTASKRASSSRSSSSTTKATGTPRARKKSR